VPILDRIDIHIEVPRVDYEKLSNDRLGETSDSIRARVQAARDIPTLRFSEYSSDIVCNADMRVGEICLGASVSSHPEDCSYDFRFRGSEEIKSVHLAEALQYHPKLMLY
jgi:magnesium chelatase family protein